MNLNAFKFFESKNSNWFVTKKVCTCRFDLALWAQTNLSDISLFSQVYLACWSSPWSTEPFQIH